MTRRCLLSILLAWAMVTLLQGCAATVVGGAATGASVVHDRRSAGAVIDDQGIELKAMQLMAKHPELDDHSSISVTSYNYTVLLSGEAENPDVRNRFARMVANIDNVRRVVDEVTIGANATLSEQSSDAYLTAKAKLALFNVELPGFDPTRVKVITQKGTVYLMGLVTRKEEDAVTEEIRNIDGVKRVVKVFERIQR